MKLDYGSGRQPKEGYMSSDFIGTPNYDFFIKDYLVMDTEDHMFDAIHCRNVIHHIPEQDLHILFAEFDRLLKPDGELIISEPREEFHEQNKFIDWIWYRWITNDTNIMVPDEYVDYKKYLVDFDIVSTVDHYNNEVLTLKKKQIMAQAV